MKTKRLGGALVLAFVSAAVIACQAGVATSDDGGIISSGGGNGNGNGTGTGNGNGTGKDAGTTGFDATASGFDASGEWAACFDSTGTTLASVKACNVASDCAIVQHQTNCCGSKMYVGVAKSSQAMVLTCEAPWDVHFPGCGCAEGPTVTEDSHTPDGGIQGVTVTCVQVGAVKECRTSS
jgi:hypothetical protein